MQIETFDEDTGIYHRSQGQECRQFSRMQLELGTLQALSRTLGALLSPSLFSVLCVSLFFSLSLPTFSAAQFM